MRSPGPRAHTPLWLWLLIGALLGTGGTLLMSAFWLPEADRPELAGVEAGGDQQPSGGQSVALSAEAPALDAEIMADARPREEANGIAVDGQLPDDSLQTPASPEAGDQGAEAARANVDENGAAGEPPSTPPAAEAALKAFTSLEEPSSPPDGPAANSPSPSLDRRADAGPDRLPSKLVLPDPPEAAAAASQPSVTGLPPGPDLPQTSTDQDPPAAATTAELPESIKQAFTRARSEAWEAAETRAGADAPLYRVQLAAVNDQAAARVYWREVNERLPGVFSQVEPIFDERLVDQRVYLRIWVGAFDDRGEALGYCGWLKQQGQDCFVTRVDNL